MTPATTGRANTSTMFEKLDIRERQELDKAIVEQSPPTYTACYQQFNLADRGISFHAFYRYARRLRTHVKMHKLAELAAPGSEDAEKLLPRFLCQELIETLITEEASSKVIHRLAQAYRMTAQVPLAKQRLELLQANQQTTRSQLVARRAALIAEVTEYQEKIRREIDAVAAIAPDPEHESTAASDKSPEPPQDRSCESPISPQSPWESSPDPKQSLLDRIDSNIDAALESRRMKGDSVFSP